MLALTRVGEAGSGDFNVVVESLSEQGQKGEQRNRIFFAAQFLLPSPPLLPPHSGPFWWQKGTYRRG
ncbi:hypothetical protein [Spirosoma utsteinense]|uniref:Uncharacterized protein n=1 Tax=Spirosoma utsteinense TaxID=2585773 RepID=A0ABR6W8F6_9BACT|nr:hypothetical protein [Spirosoma utsteinense]MBC3784114.1 hypothetical protein [Spirosoma utsteinense]MBC3792797.1 hypothetical protein [Spirosoma utsteinense]